MCSLGLLRCFAFLKTFRSIQNPWLFVAVLNSVHTRWELRSECCNLQCFFMRLENCTGLPFSSGCGCWLGGCGNARMLRLVISV